MKQFWSVLRFELNGYFKNKIYVVMSVVLMVIVMGVLSFPNIKALFAGDESPAQDTGVRAEQTADADTIAIVNEDGVLDDEALLLLSQAMRGKALRVTQEDAGAVKDKVANGDYAGAVVIDTPQSVTYIARNLGMNDNAVSLLYEAMTAVSRYEALQALGVPEAETAAILNPSVTVNVQDLGVNQSETFFYTYVMLMALYMAIMIYGQIVATSVATEKSSRTMELLITSARPNSLLFGKMIASALSGLLQIAAIFGSAVLFYNLNESVWAGNAIIASIFNMPLPMVGYVLLFFLLGFFLYAFMYGAVGSLVSRVEDVSSSIFPILMCFIVAFMIVVTAVTSGNTDSPLMVVCSFIPLTSPMAMFARIAMSTPAWYEIVISVALLIITTVGVGVLSASIYRMGVLMYGKAPKPAELIKVIRMARAKKA